MPKVILIEFESDYHGSFFGYGKRVFSEVSIDVDFYALLADSDLLEGGTVFKKSPDEKQAMVKEDSYFITKIDNENLEKLELLLLNQFSIVVDEVSADLLINQDQKELRNNNIRLAMKKGNVIASLHDLVILKKEVYANSKEVIIQVKH